MTIEKQCSQSISLRRNQRTFPLNPFCRLLPVHTSRTPNVIQFSNILFLPPPQILQRAPPTTGDPQRPEEGAQLTTDAARNLRPTLTRFRPRKRGAAPPLPPERLAPPRSLHGAQAQCLPPGAQGWRSGRGPSGGAGRGQGPNGRGRGTPASGRRRVVVAAWGPAAGRRKAGKWSGPGGL